MKCIKNMLFVILLCVLIVNIISFNSFAIETDKVKIKTNAISSLPSDYNTDMHGSWGFSLKTSSSTATFTPQLNFKYYYEMGN